jgi:general secretion pathway protein G
MFCSIKKTNLRSRHGEACAGELKRARSLGFTMLEMMVVIVIIMILASVAATAYQRHVIQAREAVLRENVRKINFTIQEYVLDKHQAPQSLDDLVQAGYFSEIPKDPMTNASDWECDQEDSSQAADPQQPGITMCHSHATGTSSEGEAYSSWH